jgi:excisionase family DNA binding protein
VLQDQVRPIELPPAERGLVVTAEGNGAVDLTLTLDDEFVEALVERVATVVVARLAADKAAPAYFGVRELASYLCCSPRAVYRLVHRGLPHRRPNGGRRLMFVRAEVDAWVRAQEGVILPTAETRTSSGH